jgi:hypothetical protein
MGNIADILQARGQLDEALRIWREDVLPICQRLGAAHDLVFGHWNLGFVLLRRNGEGDREEAREILLLALDEARRLKLPQAQQIEQLMAQTGLGADEIAPLRSQ